MKFRFDFTSKLFAAFLLFSITLGSCSTDNVVKDPADDTTAGQHPGTGDTDGSGSGDSDNSGSSDDNSAADKVSKAIALKTKLAALAAKGHKMRTYANLWTDFRTTDARPDGTVRDLYSNTTRYVFGDNQDKGDGRTDVYNREHSVPKSWWGASTSSPMYTDLFHLYPADRTANSTRSNYPLGEVTGAKQWTNGYCTLGMMNRYGYTDIVFEPADEIKGNLARTYFYFATRYEAEASSKWPEKYAYMFSRDSYPFYHDWVIKMLLEWNKLDPVDNVELERNNAVESIQGNRNPFIDDAELAEYIWGEKMGQDYDLSQVEKVSIYIR
jgi:endonuclease I